MTLDELQLDQPAKVSKLLGEASIRRRLMEMGITPGVTVLIARRAPLGDPLDIKVRGYHLSLRKYEATAIEVTQV